MTLSDFKSFPEIPYLHDTKTNTDTVNQVTGLIRKIHLMAIFTFKIMNKFQQIKTHLVYFAQFWIKINEKLLPNLHFIYIHYSCLRKQEFFTLMQCDS